MLKAAAKSGARIMMAKKTNVSELNSAIRAPSIHGTEQPVP